MKNLPGVYCKQAYVCPNTKRKGQIIHSPLSPCLPLSTPHQPQICTPLTLTSGQQSESVPNLSISPSGAQNPMMGAQANLAALMSLWALLGEPFPLGLKEEERGSEGGEQGNFLTNLHE